MKIQIIDEDIKKAIAAVTYKDEYSPALAKMHTCTSCVIFQALKRYGVDVREVGLITFSIWGQRESIPLPKEALGITRLESYKWHLTPKIEFEINYENTSN